MSKFAKRLRSNVLFQIFCGKRYKNIPLFLSIFLPNLCAALIEGASFGCILLAFAVLNGESTISSRFFDYISFLGADSFFRALSQNQAFIFFIIVAVCLQSIRSCLNYLGQFLATLLGARVQKELQIRIYQQILSLSFPYLNRYKVGELVEYAKSPETIVFPLVDTLNRIFVAKLTVLVLTAMMFCLAPILTIVIIGLFGICGLVQQLLVKRMLSASTQLSNYVVESSRQTVQNLTGIRTIYVFDRQKDVLQQLLGNIQKIVGFAKKLHALNHAITPINEVIGVILAGASLVFGAIFLENRNVAALSMLLTFMTLTYRLSGRVQILMSTIGTIAFYFGPISKLNHFLRREDKTYSSAAGKPFSVLTNAIEFKNISFSYSGDSNVLAVQDLSFFLPKGKMLALVGASGAGKSSVVDLLLRLYEPDSGAILIDGKDLCEYELGSWRGAIGVVSQEAFVFNQSIEENIRFGYLSASEEDIVEAAQAAGAHSFIVDLPEGYQTIIGERGYRLSGGEKQRLALARALVRKPQLLILDEATSNLDSHSEHLIQQALEKFQKDRTVIVVAHRLSTVLKADQILVLNKGAVVESGSHQELLEKNGCYAHFWNLQTLSHREPIEKELSSV